MERQTTEFWETRVGRVRECRPWGMPAPSLWAIMSHLRSLPSVHPLVHLHQHPLFQHPTSCTPPKFSCFSPSTTSLQQSSQPLPSAHSVCSIPTIPPQHLTLTSLRPLNTTPSYVEASIPYFSLALPSMLSFL